MDHSRVPIWLRHDMTMRECENPEKTEETVKEDGTQYVHF
jgi:hypothetical protein